MSESEERAATALHLSGVEHAIVRHGRVRSLEEAAEARGVRPADIIKTLGTITPFGSTRAWPVVADAAILRPEGRSISLGAGGHGVSATVPAEAALEALGAQVADVTSPADPR